MPTKQTYAKAKETNKARFNSLDKSPMDNISKIVCDVFNISFEEIVGDGKPRKYVIPRQTIAYFLKFHKNNYPLWIIANYLGYQEHGVVSHGIEIVKNTLLLYSDYKAKFKTIETRIKENDFVQHAWEKRESLKDLDKHF